MIKPKGIILLITAALILGFSVNTNIQLYYYLFLSAISIFTISLFSLAMLMPNVSTKRSVQDIAYEDDLLNIKLHILNNRNFPCFSLEIIDRFKGEDPLKRKKHIYLEKLRSKEARSVDYAMRCYKRGLWDLGPVTIVSQDLLGFFEARKTNKGVLKILVYPRLFNIIYFPEPKSSSLTWMGVETAKISGDSHEFFGVREYQRSDLKSRIHWPLTARHNELIVKEFERSAAQEVTIVLDLKKGHDIGIGKDTTLEYSVKIAGSVSRYLLDKGVFVQFVGYGLKEEIMYFGKGGSHMHRILEYLAVVQADGGTNLNKALDEVTFIVPNQSTLMAMLLDSDIDSLSSLVQFKARGVKLILIIFAAQTFGKMREEDIDKHYSKGRAEEFDNLLLSLEASVYRISKGDKLEEKFEFR